jgi:hypothetical protein
MGGVPHHNSDLNLLSALATTSNGDKTTAKKSLRNSGSLPSSPAVSKQSASTNGGKQQQPRKKKQQQPNARWRSLQPDEDTSLESGVVQHNAGSHRGVAGLNNTSGSSSSSSGQQSGAVSNEALNHPWLPRQTPTVMFIQRYHLRRRVVGGGSEGSGSEDELTFEVEYDRVSDEELMLIATGTTSYVAVPPLEDEDTAGDNKDEFCPFSWEARVNGCEWDKWSEDAVRTFMKEELNYEIEVVADDESLGLTEEEIRLAKQQISEKKKKKQQQQGLLSEFLKKREATA